MKKRKIIIIVVIGILSLIGYGVYRFFYGPSVSFKDKLEIKKYAENYLTKKYGNHNFKVTGIKYEFDMDTLFDYSNPTGYWVDFKSDVVPSTWLIIDGLVKNNYKVKYDYFIEKYYYPDSDSYEIYQIKTEMIPKKEIQKELLEELKNEFEPNASELQCNIITLVIPDDYGKIPTLEEIKTNTKLYKVTNFKYIVSNKIEDKNEYKNRLKLYLQSKNINVKNIYFHKDNTLIEVFVEY